MTITPRARRQMKRDGTQSPRTIGALLPAQHLRTSHSPAAPASLLFPKLLRSHLGSPPSLSLPSPPLTWSRPLPHTQAETTQMAPPFLSGFISCLPSDAAWQEILQMSLTFFPLLRDNGYRPKYGGGVPSTEIREEPLGPTKSDLNTQLMFA